jgi:LacI family transcriptional regulator
MPTMTIKDLAAKTGYAVGTVSRVLNNHPNVSEKARAAILAAVEESGFQLNQNAKQLKQTHANSILVILKGSGNILFAEMLEVIQTALHGTRYPLHVDYLHGGDNEVRRAKTLIREKNALGVIFLGGNLENFQSDFHDLGVPAVLVTNSAESLGFDNLSSVYIDDRKAARQAVETLISLGHKRIAVIGGHRLYSDISRMRWEGVLDGLKAHGLSIDPEQDYATVYFSPEGGYQGAVELMRRRRNYSAIFTMSDQMAIGAFRALKDYKLDIPGDVSVIGFDGLPVDEYLVPRLSTVNQPTVAMATRGLEFLLDAIENGTKAKHEAVPFTLLYRESTGPVKV